MTRRRLFAAAARFSATLSHAGVASGDRVVLLGSSGIDWLVAFAAIAMRGAVPVLIDPRLARADIEAMIDHAQPTLTVTDRELALDGAAPQVPFPTDEEATTSERPSASIDPQSPAVILYTSGTVSRPKGVVLSHAALSAQAAANLRTGYGRRLFQRPLMVLPLNFSLAFSAALTTLHAGGEIVFCPSLMPHDILERAQRCLATGMFAVPRLLESFERAIAGNGRGSGAIHVPADGGSFPIVCGGAALAEDLRLTLAGHGLRVFPGYGMAEAGPTIAANTPDASRAGTVGRAHPGVEIAIDSMSGEILVQSPSMMLGYFRDEAATAEALRRGWLRTGDSGRIDGDGFLTVTGRLKDVIVLSSGRKISPEGVEAALTAAGDLAECCLVEERGVLTLIAVPHQDRRSEVDLGRRLRAACRNLAPHERPAALRLRTSSLPRTPSGKLLRRVVREQLDLARQLEPAT